MHTGQTRGLPSKLGACTANWWWTSSYAPRVCGANFAHAPQTGGMQGMLEHAQQTGPLYSNALTEGGAVDRLFEVLKFEVSVDFGGV